MLGFFGEPAFVPAVDTVLLRDSDAAEGCGDVRDRAEYGANEAAGVVL